MENENPTRSQYLDGKRELTDEDIIKILDLPNEKPSQASIQSYTRNSYRELKENPEKLAELTEELKSAEYLKYHDTYISKSKLLFEQSAVLYNEIPCLIVLNEMKVPAYLLPYEYAKESDGVKKEFADSLKNDYFTDFKRVFSSRINSAFKKDIQQGRDIFFLVSNEKLDNEEIKRQLIDRVNYHDVADRSGTYIFFSEKDSKCYSFEVDKKGQIGESSDFDLKQFRLALSDKPLSLGEELDSSSSKSMITDKQNDVNITNSVFESLLARGAIEEFKTHRDIGDRIERYTAALSKLEKLNELIVSEGLKVSNDTFIQNEKQSRFYQDVFAQNQIKQNIQGEKNMAQEKQIIAEIGFADGEIKQYDDAREFLNDLAAASRENAHDTTFRVYTESDELKRRASDVKIDNYDPIEAAERMYNGYEWNDVEHEEVSFKNNAEGRMLLKDAENGRLTILDARDILDAVEKKGMTLRYDPLPNSYVVDGWTAADGEKLDNYIVSMSELKRLAGIEISENSQQNQIQEKKTARTPEEEQAYQEWEEMLEDNQQAEDIIERMQGVPVEEQIEKMQVNGGMSEAAMEADIAAEENPRPDYIDEQGNPHWFDEEEPEEPVDMSGYEFAEYIHSPDFIDKFGDWEKANRLEKLKTAEPIIGNESIIIADVDVSDLVARLRQNYSLENLKQLQAIEKDIGTEVLEQLRKQQGLNSYDTPALINSDTGIIYKIQMQGIKEVGRHNLFQRGHLEAVRNIPELIEKAVFIGKEKNEDRRNPKLKEFHYYASGMKIDDEDFTAKIVFTLNDKGEFFYDQSLSNIEKGRLVDIIQEKNRLEVFNPKKSQDNSKPIEVLNPLISQKNSNAYYDKRLINICQVPQMPYLEKNPVTGKWQPTQEAVELVKNGKLYIEKNGQKYQMVRNMSEENKVDVTNILEVVDRREMLYFNSDEVSAREYKIRIDEGLFSQLVPERYSKTTFEEGEIPAITYRQSTTPDVPDQFLISKFKQGNYDYPLIQTTIDIKEEELLNQIKNNVENYEAEWQEKQIQPLQKQIISYHDELEIEVIESDKKLTLVEPAYNNEFIKLDKYNEAGQVKNSNEITAELDALAKESVTCGHLDNYIPAIAEDTIEKKLEIVDETKNTKFHRFVEGIKQFAQEHKQIIAGAAIGLSFLAFSTPQLHAHTEPTKYHEVIETILDAEANETFNIFNPGKYDGTMDETDYMYKNMNNLFNGVLTQEEYDENMQSLWDYAHDEEISGESHEITNNTLIAQNLEPEDNHDTDGVQDNDSDSIDDNNSGVPEEKSTENEVSDNILKQAQNIAGASIEDEFKTFETAVNLPPESNSIEQLYNQPERMNSQQQVAREDSDTSFQNVEFPADFTSDESKNLDNVEPQNTIRDEEIYNKTIQNKEEGTTMPLGQPFDNIPLSVAEIGIGAAALSKRKRNKFSESDEPPVNEKPSDTLEQETLNNAADLLKNMKFTSENYKKLLNVINEISNMNGLNNLEVPKKEEILAKESGNNNENLMTLEASNGEKIKSIENEMNESGKENTQTQIYDGQSEIIFGETTLPSFVVLVDGKMRTIENALVTGQNKEKGAYFVEANGEKIELPKKTFDTLLEDKIKQEQQKVRLAEGRTIVFEDKEHGVNGTEIPEWAMYTQNGLETYKGFVARKFNAAENSYTLSNGETTINVTAERFKEITSPERFENRFDENSPAWKKLCEKQYKDYFEVRSNTAYNFKHNLAVYCRKEANSPCDALHLAKEIIARMSTAEQKKVRSVIKQITNKNETQNEVIARLYHDSIKEIPLQENYIKKYQPQNVIARPFYDTLSSYGQKVESDPALVKGTNDYNLKIGTTIKNVDIQTDKLFGKGKDLMHFDELKVISASKEGNSITLMDSNKSFIKVPRDTFLSVYKEKQIREIKQEQKHNRNNTMIIGYA